MVKNKLTTYQNEVILKYQTYNGLFLNLPFADDMQAGQRLPIFTKVCQEMINSGESIPDAVEKFLQLVPIKGSNNLKLLNKFLQFIERQIVLFDALENQSFNKINDLSGKGSIDELLQNISTKEHLKPKLERLLKEHKARLVLTAHPTQFYPKNILSIINRLESAIDKNDLLQIHNLFLQLALTSFHNKNKPTPSDEVTSVIWYLEHIFYQILPIIQSKLDKNNSNLELGFWPGGDRDGNPYVTHKITLETADKLHTSLMKLYHEDIYQLRTILTFDIVHDSLTTICAKIKKDGYKTSEEIINELVEIKNMLMDKYHGIFHEHVDDVILKIKIFGINFAKLDIRQNSAIHRQVIHNIFINNNLCNNYLELATEEQFSLLNKYWQNKLDIITNNELDSEVINTIYAISEIQSKYGASTIERYIISNTDSATSILEVLWLVKLVNNTLPENKQISLQIIPLFETIDDLKHAMNIMDTLYNNSYYHENLIKLKNRQTIMLGFSDGTKDGGYLMANWSIFRAKKQLSEQAKQQQIEITFFDGRGGPPSRGGGNIYNFYQGMAEEIRAYDIQLTIQGQTISANFGTPDSAVYNFEHLLSAGVSGRLLQHYNCVFDYDKEELIDELANYSLEAYLELRHNELFLDYLQEITPLKYLSDANIGSRPAKRSNDSKLRLEELRAIPFGSAWMLMKQNILGYYGFGTAIDKLIKKDSNNLERLQYLYECSRVFKGLVDNSLESLSSTDFSFSAHLAKDVKYGDFWHKLKNEADLSINMLTKITKSKELIHDEVKHSSSKHRTEIIKPLLFIQQYAMEKLRNIPPDDEHYRWYEHLIKKAIATNINASRNSI
ncbi:MAG: phosphoenolpyruvate carboxylase [Burkholderiales bacterium]|nr:phosphoenolpyruvate carboxylase [Burkholderiales bacterium]